MSVSAKARPIPDRRSEFDVTNSIKTTDPQAVATEIRHLYLDLYRKSGAAGLQRPFRDFTEMYYGEHPAYRACDTGYHDIQHVLDVTLAMARLLHSYERTGKLALGEKLFRLGVLLALYHDCGYIRHRKDTLHHNGAEYTQTHVTRGAQFLRGYLPRIGMTELAPVAPRILHFTGYEVPISKIRLPHPIFRAIGNLLGSADILAQMADRCYLEKCYDRLFPEFVLGGIARQYTNDGRQEVVFASAADLIAKTPYFFESAARRLHVDLDCAYRYAEGHFGGHNYYVEEVEKNVRYARAIASKGDISRLRRRPPSTLATQQAQLQLI